MATPPQSARSPPELMDDVVHEIFLRLSPDSAKDIVCASLACKSWRRVLSDPAFLRRYRALHRPPPWLKFLSYGHKFFGLVSTRRVAVLEGDKLYVWSWIEAHHGWVQRRVIDLKTLLPAHALSFSPFTFEFQDRTDTIVMSTEVGMFKVELSSGQVRKIGARGDFCYTIVHVPYMSVVTQEDSVNSPAGAQNNNSRIRLGDVKDRAQREEEEAAAMPQPRWLVLNGANLRKNIQDQKPEPNILTGFKLVEIND